MKCVVSPSQDVTCDPNETDCTVYSLFLRLPSECKCRKRTRVRAHTYKNLESDKIMPGPDHRGRCLKIHGERKGVGCEDEMKVER